MLWKVGRGGAAAGRMTCGNGPGLLPSLWMEGCWQVNVGDERRAHETCATSACEVWTARGAVAVAPYRAPRPAPPAPTEDPWPPAAAPVRTVEHVDAVGGRPPLELVRSTGRRASATAFVRDGRIVVQLPAGMDPAAESALVARLVDRVSGRQRVERVGGDAELAARAQLLADRHLDGVRPASVAWSGRMRRRWGSCTPSEGTIRISRSLAAFPDWVLDYVLVHELAHLVEPGHGAAFHALVDRYPHAARARGFLEGVQFADARHDPDASPPAPSSPSDESSSPVD